MRHCLPILLFVALIFRAGAQDFLEAGPLAHHFRLTLEPGERREIFGPLFSTQQGETNRLWTLAPFASHYVEPELERTEFEFLYPLLGYARFGTEWRLQVGQFFNFHGSTTVDDETKRRRNLFPFFFSQRSSNPTNDYWALLPFYGHMQNHLFRHELRFVAAPLYVWSRKGELETANYLFPFFHRRQGGGVRGWQWLPLLGHETKSVLVRTNTLLEELETIPGYDKWFALFPFFHHENLNLGTTNEEHRRIFLPLYSFQRSPARDNTTLLWPFFSYTDDHENQFHEWGLPYPFLGWARGPGKQANRVWPLWGKATNANLTTDFVLWPLYTHRLIHTPEVVRERTRILWFPYSDTRLTSPQTGIERRRRDAWPFFSWKRDFDGRERLQVLAITEPIIPDNRGLERSWEPLWTLYRAEKNPQTGAASQSLLWNLWRRDALKDSTRQSFFFGVIRTRREPAGLHWRFFWQPFDRATNAPAKTKSTALAPSPQRGDFVNAKPTGVELSQR